MAGCVSVVAVVEKMVVSLIIKEGVETPTAFLANYILISRTGALWEPFVKLYIGRSFALFFNTDDHWLFARRKLTKMSMLQNLPLIMLLWIFQLNYILFCFVISGC